MRDQPARAGVEDRVVLVEAPRQVVGRQDRGRGGPGEAVRSHHRDVGVGDRQDAGGAVRGGGDGAALRVERVAGQERREVRAHRDRTDAGAAATVRDAERLVQVEVRDVAAELARLGQPDERVEVGAVDVDLAAGLVDQPADRADLGLVDAVGRRVGQHDRRDAAAVGLELGAQVVEGDAAVGRGGHDDDAHPREDGRRGVGAVRRRRDDADGALVVATAAVVVADGEQAGELTLRAGVGLQRHLVVAGDLRQPVLERVGQLGVSTGLVGRRERVQRCEAGLADRLHLRGRVQLHGAGAERDHRAVECEVAVGQQPQVAQHRGL